MSKLNLKTEKGIRLAIASIGRRQAQLANDIHNTAVACLVHAKEHGDVTLMRDLINALGKSQRGEALRVWVADFSPIFIDKKDDEKCGLTPKSSPQYREWRIKEASETPYYEHTDEAVKVFTASDFLGRIHGARQAFEKACAEGTFEGNEQEQAELRATLDACVMQTNMSDDELKERKQADKLIKEAVANGGERVAA